MANSFLSLLTLCFIVLFLFLNPGGVLKPVNGQAPGQGVWCIPKPSSSDQALLENINYACGIVNCAPIHAGGPCYKPNTIINHASVAMNLYYQKSGRNSWNCDFNKTGVVAIVDPSSPDCKYEYTA